MVWRLARSLETLRSEVDAWAPGRSKATDGTIGDAAHAARDSRHNPNRFGVVTALDLTHDPAGGCDIHQLARRLAAAPHVELAYIISRGQIWRRTTHQWGPYTGANPHDRHAHFAVGTGPDGDPRPPYDSTAPWGVNQEDQMTPDQEHKLDQLGRDVRYLGDMVDSMLRGNYRSKTNPGDLSWLEEKLAPLAATLGTIQGALEDLNSRVAAIEVADRPSGNLTVTGTLTLG